MNQTPNYGLNQWEAGDRVLRAAFNTDNAKIDTAIRAAAVKAAEEHVYAGTFVGNGQDGRVLQLPWAPKFILLIGRLIDTPTIGFVVPGDFSYIQTRVILSEDNLYGPALNGDKVTFQNSGWFNSTGHITRYILFR